jgi:hypothetical protein
MQLPFSSVPLIRFRGRSNLLVFAYRAASPAHADALYNNVPRKITYATLK